MTKTPGHPVAPRFAQRDRPEKTANNIGMRRNHRGSGGQIKQNASISTLALPCSTARFRKRVNNFSGVSVELTDELQQVLEAQRLDNRRALKLLNLRTPCVETSIKSYDMASVLTRLSRTCYALA